MSAASEVTLQELFCQVCVTKPFLSGNARGQQYFLVLRRSKDMVHLTFSREYYEKSLLFSDANIQESGCK